MAEETPRAEDTVSRDAVSRDAGGSDVGLEVSGIPMKKTSPTTWVAVGGGVLILGLLLVWGSSGGESTKASAEPAKEAAGEPRLSAKEAQEHLLKTQKAMAAAQEEAAQAEARAKPPEAEEAAPEPAAPEPASPEAAAPRAPAPKAVASQDSKPPAKAVSPQQSKKKMDSLDSLGADITSALK